MSTRPDTPDTPEPTLARPMYAELVDQSPKAYLQSLTVWGVAVYVLAWALSHLGWDIGPAGVDHLLTLTLELAQAAGLGTAIVGLRRARKPLAGVLRAPQEPQA